MSVLVKRQLKVHCLRGLHGQHTFAGKRVVFVNNLVMTSKTETAFTNSNGPTT